MRNKILLFSLLIWSIFFEWVNAWVVPGTIQTSTVTANVYCSATSNYYAPTYWYCDSWTKTAKVWSWDYLYDYSGTSWNSWYYAPGSSFTAIDSWETCSWESQGTSHTPHSTTSFNCTFWSGTGTTTDSNSYESWGYDWVCSPKKWVNNLITSYNQIGWVNRSTSSTSWACKVEWRYATTDNTAPNITINSVSKVFINKDTVWCNIEKYKDSWYDKKLHPWCAEYAKQNTNISWNQDLLKGLDIKVDNDVSGIWKVDVKVGNCSTTYVSPVTDTSILQSTTSASGVKSQYTSWFTISYNSSFTAFWVTQQSLLSKFWKSRLDECLWNGKNNLVVTTYDMSRGADWVTLAWNSKTFTTPGIFIDNNTSIIEKTWDLVKDNISHPDIWRNFSLEWNIQVGESVNDKSLWECKLTTGTGSCWALKPWFVWTAPLWVHPTTWIFTQYTCDGLTFPLDTECVQQAIPAIPKVCTGTIPSTAIQSNTWWLIVDTPWQNIDSAANCYYEIPTVYCTAWWTVPCVVKPGWPVIVTPVVNWVCWSANGMSVSTAPSSWLCTSWTASSVTGVWPWNWTCEWASGWTDVSCSAAKSVVSSCNFEPTITWWGWKFYWSWPKCYNNAANSWWWVNSKYTCDSTWKLYYDWLPSSIWAFKYLWADKENCFVDCVKPATCWVSPAVWIACNNSEISTTLQSDIYNVYKSQESWNWSGYSQWDYLDVDNCSIIPSWTTPDWWTMSWTCQVKWKFCFYNSASVLEWCNWDTDTTDWLTFTCNNGVWEK